MFLLFLGPQGPLVIPLIDLPVRPPALNESLDPLYKGICLLNYQKTRQTNPMPPHIPPDPSRPLAPHFGPLDIILELIGPSRSPLLLYK